MDKKDAPKAKIHDDLEGFEISVNEFGQVVRTRKVEFLNEFLNTNLHDLKLAEHPEFDEKGIRKKESEIPE